MKFLVVDHVYHKKTKSSVLLFEILNQFDCRIETCYIDPDDINSVSGDLENIIAFANQEWDAIFLWQIDYLGSYFARKGHKVFIFPMVDASLGMPDVHWSALDQCKFICFSLALHSKISLFTQSSRFYQFYPDAYANQVNTNGADSAFFWLRDRSSLINLENVLRILPTFVSKLHVHSLEENKKYIEDVSSKFGNPNLKITFSSWFDSRQDYLRLVKNSLFFIAPRESEGIGLSVVEALQNNRIVIAHDSPTHNEYISNFQNGILLNFNDKSMISPVLIDDNQINTILSNLSRQHVIKSSAWAVSRSSMHKFIESSINGDSPSINVISDEHIYVKKLLLCHTNLQQYVSDINQYEEERLSKEASASIFIALRESAKLFAGGELQKSLDCIENARIQYQDCSLLATRRQFIMSHLNRLKDNTLSRKLN